MSNISFLRTILSRSIGVPVGSTNNLDHPFALNQLMQGQRGESLIDEALIVKTYFPTSLDTESLTLNKVVVCYRNPEDTLLELFNLLHTYDPSLSLSFEYFQGNFQLWDDFVKQMLPVYAHWYDYWIKESQNTPICFVNYDKLVNDKNAILKQILEFVFDQSIDNTYLSERLSKVLDQIQDTTVKRNSRIYYSFEQLKMMDETCGSMIQYFEGNNIKKGSESGQKINIKGESQFTNIDIIKEIS